MTNKRFKDPIYGYIEIDEKLITQVVDSASFQRLRDVMQTSYSPLYASAVHNRFVHSIGVYHLACIASKAFRNKELRIIIPQIEQYINIFQLACLLHDVGHAPFSHTGEKYFFVYYARKYEGQQISISNLRKQMLYFANEINIDRESINYK